MELREATADDAPFLRAMLVEACNWSGEAGITGVEIDSRPELKRYISGWPREGDFGLLAIDDGVLVGAVWARTFPPAAPGYGFVAADVPELSMAVVAGHRGRGVGRHLLQGIVELAQRCGWSALSLSVEDGNPAKKLYRVMGFVTVGRSGNADTMLRDFETAT